MSRKSSFKGLFNCSPMSQHLHKFLTPNRELPFHKFDTVQRKTYNSLSSQKNLYIILQGQKKCRQKNVLSIGMQMKQSFSELYCNVIGRSPNSVSHYSIQKLYAWVNRNLWPLFPELSSHFSKILYSCSP